MKFGQVDLFTKRIRRPPPPPERSLHIAVADALAWGCRDDWEWTHFPAGELRTKETGALLKRMGLKTGWSDFLLLSPEGWFHVLELKRRGEKPTDEQERFLNSVDGRGGCRAAWCNSFEGAMSILRAWGALKDSFKPQI